jgi:hypothetical protein
VQGCIVSPQQAVGFSKLFGLIIKETEMLIFNDTLG